MNPHLASLIVAVALSATGVAHAERADRQKPMNIEADALTYDDKQKLSVFTGNVVLTKGSILMRGGKLEVRQDEQGNQYGVLYAANKQRAFFRQKREGLDEYMEGEGQTIHYDSKADTIRLLTQAEVRRLVGSRVADQLMGSDILYNNTTEVMSVDGGVRSQSGSPAASAKLGRVRAVLTPQAEAAPVSGAAPLQSTPKLEGGSR